MKSWAKWTIALGLSLTAVAGTWLAVRQRNSSTTSRISLEERAEEAFQYAKRHGMNTEYAFFLDYSIPSGTPRLFVWDYSKNKVVAKTYVMHGVGGGSTDREPVFSNKKGSMCSSLGRFEVTKSHGYRLKRSFRLKGLDRSCSNAFPRGLMIHCSTWVDRWHWKKYIPLHAASCQGCVTVSCKGMNYLERLIKSQPKPILLWSYV